MINEISIDILERRKIEMMIGNVNRHHDKIVHSSNNGYKFRLVQRSCLRLSVPLFRPSFETYDHLLNKIELRMRDSDRIGDRFFLPVS